MLRKFGLQHRRTPTRVIPCKVKKYLALFPLIGKTSVEGDSNYNFALLIKCNM